MIFLEIMVGKRDFRTAQEALSRIRPEDCLLISLDSRAVVWRVLIQPEQTAAVVETLRRSIRSFSLRAVCRDASDFLPRITAADAPCAAGAAGRESEHGEAQPRSPFGFKRLEDSPE